MTEGSAAVLSVSALFAEREERHRRDQAAAEQLHQRRAEERADFKKRLDTFRLTDAATSACLGRIRHAFENGETELMITSFPSDFCTDGGRSIINAGAPPINKPTGKQEEPEWLKTLPVGLQPIYEYWKTSLKPGGFHLDARIINYPDGKPGDVGLFFTWPKDTPEA